MATVSTTRERQGQVEPLQVASQPQAILAVPAMPLICKAWLSL
jgi:hypothetical protein